MKDSWTQPSLSRDFFLLSAAVFIVLLLVSARVTYLTYERRSEQVISELETESIRIERSLSAEMENASYLLTALGKEIILDRERDLTSLAQMLKSFDGKGNLYSIFSWIDPNQKLIVSSNRGILDKPVDISDRDYVKRASVDPWKMTIGIPIQGRVSNHWVIPVAMGITDYTGKYIGTIMLSIDINILTERISQVAKRNGISFAILSKTLIPLTQVSDNKNFVNDNFPAQTLVNVNFSQNKSGVILHGGAFWGVGNYAYYRLSNDYPYIILLGYDAGKFNDSNDILLGRLLQILTLSSFFIVFLWIIRTRMIRPVEELSLIANEVAKGAPFTSISRSGPMEIRKLADQIKRIADYIAETRRISDEQRHKMFMLKQSQERAQLEKRAKSEFLIYACQQARLPLTHIINNAQVIKDQLQPSLDNRKYKQYASDIMNLSQQLLAQHQELLTLAKFETGYADLSEKELSVAFVIMKAVELLDEQIQNHDLEINVKLPDPSPRIMANEICLEHIITNLLLYLFKQLRAGRKITISTATIHPNKEKAFFAINILTDNVTEEQLSKFMTANLDPNIVAEDEERDFPWEMARFAAELQGCSLKSARFGNNGIALAVLFDIARLRLTE